MDALASTSNYISMHTCLYAYTHTYIHRLLELVETVTDTLPVPPDSTQPLILPFSTFAVAAQTIDNVSEFSGLSFNVFASPSFSAIDSVTFSSRQSNGSEASLYLPGPVLTPSNGSNMARLSHASYLDESLFIQRDMPVSNGRTTGLLGSLVVATKVVNETILEVDSSPVTLLFTVNPVSIDIAICYFFWDKHYFDNMDHSFYRESQTLRMQFVSFGIRRWMVGLATTLQSL